MPSGIEDIIDSVPDGRMTKGELVSFMEKCTVRQLNSILLHMNSRRADLIAEAYKYKASSEIIQDEINRRAERIDIEYLKLVEKLKRYESDQS